MGAYVASWALPVAGWEFLVLTCRTIACPSRRSNSVRYCRYYHSPLDAVRLIHVTSLSWTLLNYIQAGDSIGKAGCILRLPMPRLFVGRRDVKNGSLLAQIMPLRGRGRSMPKRFLCRFNARQTSRNGVLSDSGQVVGVKAPETVERLAGGPGVTFAPCR